MEAKMLFYILIWQLESISVRLLVFSSYQSRFYKLTETSSRCSNGAGFLHLLKYYDLFFQICLITASETQDYYWIIPHVEVQERDFCFSCCLVFKVLNMLAKLQPKWKQLYFVSVYCILQLIQAFTLFCELFTIYGDFTVREDDSELRRL